MTKVYNQKNQTEKRRRLRSEMPPAEHILWKFLRAKQLKNYKFRRQYGVGPFVVDFYCAQLKLAIELDGESHFLSQEVRRKDKERQQYIEKFGITFLRFTNDDVRTNTENVVETILQYLP